MNSSYKVIFLAFIGIFLFHTTAHANLWSCLRKMEAPTLWEKAPKTSVDPSLEPIDSINDGNTTYILTAEGLFRKTENKEAQILKGKLFTKYLALSQNKDFIFVAMGDDGVALINKKNGIITTLQAKTLDLSSPSNPHSFEASKVIPIDENIIAVANGRVVSLIDIVKGKAIFSVSLGIPPDELSLGEYKGKKALFVAASAAGVQVLDLSYLNDHQKVAEVGIRPVAYFGKNLGLRFLDWVSYINQGYILIGNSDPRKGFVKLLNLKTGAIEKDIYSGDVDHLQMIGNQVFIRDSKSNTEVLQVQ